MRGGGLPGNGVVMARFGCYHVVERSHFDNCQNCCHAELVEYIMSFMQM